jgi:hypothetical protein
MLFKHISGSGSRKSFFIGMLNQLLLNKLIIVIRLCKAKQVEHSYFL